MRRTLLVAWHEFANFVTRRGFLIGLVLLPAWIVIASTLPRWIASSAPPRAFTVIDRAGGYAQALQQAASLADDEDKLAALRAYMRAHGNPALLGARDPALAGLVTGGESGRPAVAALNAQGGIQAVLGKLAPYIKAGAPPPQLPQAHIVYRPPPPALAAANPTQFLAEARKELGEGKPLDAIVVVPKDFGTADAQAAYWTSGPNRQDLKDFVQRTLTDALRRNALARAAPGASAALLDVSAGLDEFDPAGNGAAHELSFADQARRYAPSALAFLLILVVIMNAAALMSAVIEEKSNRVVEVMLSCVSPREFMTGKLLGAAGASLLTLAIWVGFAVAAVWTLMPGGPFVVASVAGAIVSGGTLPMLLLCFVCGLLTYASIFLAIGSLASSIQDAQAYVGPTMIVVIAPMIVMPALLSDPNGAFAVALTWIPIYTPFFMMFRLPWHPPALQVVLATVLMIAFTAFLVVQMARIFAAHVLSTDRPPKFGVFLRSLVGFSKHVAN